MWSGRPWGFKPIDRDDGDDPSVENFEAAQRQKDRRWQLPGGVRRKVPDPCRGADCGMMRACGADDHHAGGYRTSALTLV